MEKKNDKIVVTIPVIERTDIDKLNIELRLKVVESDYQPEVDNELNQYRKTAAMDGFRRGKIPIGIIKKKYGDQVKAEKVNKAAQAAINKYIVDNKLKIFGNPLMKEEYEKKEIKWEHEKEFEWVFEIGLQPDISVEMLPKDKFTKYDIQVDEGLIDSYINDIRNKYGTMTSPETVKGEDIAFCQFVQIDEKHVPVASGVRHTSAISISKVKNKLLFLGLKKGESVRLAPTEIIENVDDLSKIFGVNVDVMTKVKDSKFSCTILTVNRMQQANINQELFDKAYGKDSIKNEKEFRDRVVKDAKLTLGVESDNLLVNDTIKYYVKKAKLKFPEEFLKKWLLRTTDGKTTEDNLEENYKMYETKLEWQLIEQKIAIDNKITVKDDEIKADVKERVLEYANLKEKKLNDKQIEELMLRGMSDPKQREYTYKKIYEHKFLRCIKDVCKIKTKKIAYDKFYKMANERNN